MGARRSLYRPARAVSPLPFGAYARVYDRQGQSLWSERMVDFTFRLLAHYEAAPHTVLELACGTGVAAFCFAHAGYRVIAVDRSAAMLAAARHTPAPVGGSVRLIQADMRAFTLPEPVELVTCYFDSLNYLTDPADLTETFRQVRAALVPGGLFVADMNTVAGLAADWNDRVRVRDCAGTFVIEHTTWDEAARIGTLALTAFIPGETSDDLIEEIHQERGYTVAEITAALAAARLTPLDIFACDRRLGPTLAPPDAETHRVVFVARKSEE